MTKAETLFDPTAYTTWWGNADRFGAPPFSVLDTRGGRWRSRRALWDLLDFESDLGRSDELIYRGNDKPGSLTHKLNEIKPTSLFDPVLAELILSWWAPVGGVVLDPFAGGAVRGTVSAALGRSYHGVDLSPDQITANRRVWDRIEHIGGPAPTWYTGDSTVQRRLYPISPHTWRPRKANCCDAGAGRRSP